MVERGAQTWSILRAAAAFARRTAAADLQQAAGLDAGGRRCAAGSDALLLWRPGAGWALGPAAPQASRAMLELYLPICSACAERPLTVGHLGQSLDGYIATGAGDSDYVTGEANLAHLHRMRALADAVVVGAETVAADVRVVIDPQCRLRRTYRVFTDAAAPTIVFCAAEHAGGTAFDGDAAGAGIERIAVDSRNGRLALDQLLDALRTRGCAAVFVEGGGATVSGFLDAGLLDRLQVAVAPLLIGRGRPGIRLPARDSLGDCLRPACRSFAMGADVLFDCDLRAPVDAATRGATEPASSIRRIH
jgi:diaminohydroxyphosphoribosylaminopyrimidine deaminase/5-amino-6-(5-phosphoribosylamino)uracil reductase